jgi:hypothetical protein
MKTSEPLIVGIAEMYRNHPIPNLPNFKIVPWEDQETILAADIYIQNNIIEQKRKKFKRYYQFILDSKKPFIVTESSVFRRNMVQPPNPMAYHRYSWTSYFQDEGDYCNNNSPSDRWLRIQKEQNIEIKDWKNSGDYVLLIMQRPGDSSLKSLLAKYKTYEGFVSHTLGQIRNYTDRPIKVRMHPLRQDRQLAILNQFDVELSSNTHGAKKLEGGDGLYKDLQDARCVVGFNSNALTESVCEGIPTFSMCASSMAWECSNKDLSLLEKPAYFDRTQWLNNLGYCQWREDEISQGLPWNHLKGKLY